jgi:hypothetical protein
MPYNNSERMIVAPVSIRDVQIATGCGDNDLGTLITNANINMWARFKPVRYPSVGLITDAQRASVNHGISIPTPETGTSVTSQKVIDAAANYGDWAYLKPTGGASQPFRLADFANTISQGYYHAAQPPIQLNYPRGGWTFIKGGTSKALVMSFDLDPSDSAVNLQSYDFMGSLDLRQYKLITYVDGIGLFEADDFILDSEGEVSGSTIAVMIPSTTGSYSREAYVCMYRTNGNTKEFLPIMASDGYTPDNLTIYIKDDAEASGGGIPGADTQEMFNNVEFSSELNGTYRTAWVSTDNGTAEWCLVSQGSLYVKMTLKNTSGSTSTVQRAHFQLDLNGQGLVSATTMYNSSKSAVTSVQIANNGTATIYLFFDAIFSGLGSDWSTSNKNSSWSMDFVRNSATLFGGDIYAMSGTNGWVAR